MYLLTHSNLQQQIFISIHLIYPLHTLLVRFVPLVIDHNLGYRIWPSLAQDSITQVMLYNLAYDL